MSTGHDFIEEDYMSGEPRGFKATFAGLVSEMGAMKVKGSVIGAVALAAHGIPRYTEDIDVLLLHRDARVLVRRLLDVGWKGPPPSRDVFLYVMESPSGVEVDVLGAVEDLYLDVIENFSEPATFMGVEAPVPNPAAYVLLKLQAATDSPEDELKHLGDALMMVRKSPRRVEMAEVNDYVRAHAPDLGPMLRMLEGHIDAAERHAGRK